MGIADRDYMKAPSWQREQRRRLAEWQWRTWRQPQRRRNRAALLVMATALTAAGVTAGYAVGAKVGPFAPEPALVWGGTAFDDREEFERWLEARGGSYAEWARKHPAAAARLER